MLDKLKFCPLCGGEAELCSMIGLKYSEIRCKCGVAIKGEYPGSVKYALHPDGRYKADHLAIAAWNRRTGGWIAVTEKLPEEGETFLGWHKDGFVIMTVNMFDEMDEVTHWMPLPQGPEGADRNG